MVGAVIIALSGIGKELIATAEYIVGKIEGLVAVSIDSETNGLLVEVVTDIIYENHIERFSEDLLDQSGPVFPVLLSSLLRHKDIGASDVSATRQRRTGCR